MAYSDLSWNESWGNFRHRESPFPIQRRSPTLSRSYCGSAISPWRTTAGRKSIVFAACCCCRLENSSVPTPLSKSMSGSDPAYIHGMIHRVEGDFWNAKYWFRRSKKHPAFLGTQIDPFRITDLVEETKGKTPSATTTQEPDGGIQDSLGLSLATVRLVGRQIRVRATFRLGRPQPACRNWASLAPDKRQLLSPHLSDGRWRHLLTFRLIAVRSASTTPRPIPSKPRLFVSPNG